MSEVNKIARFVGIEACKSIFSDESTFVLRSPGHYRRLYETGKGGAGKGDGSEGFAKTIDGRESQFHRWVMSCWTILKKDEPTSDEWNIFKENDQNIVAIISTPSKVCEFLKKTLETDEGNSKPRFLFHPVKHDIVNYGNTIDSTGPIDDVPFNKDAKFIKQQEYRFALTHGWSNMIDSFIFCGGIDYMEKRFANPKMGIENKEVLRETLIKARSFYGGDFENMEMGDIIANVDILFE